MSASQSRSGASGSKCRCTRLGAGAAADGGEGVELVVLTFWQSLEALRGFAGADLTAAVVDAEAVPLLTRFDRQVRHYELVVRDEV